MRPEACYSALQLLDRWALCLAQMRGEPLPELPLMPGRRIVAPPIPTPEQDAQQRDADLKAAQVWQSLADSEGGDVD